MSADLLRRAANLMRETHRHDVTREAETFVAVADWLDRVVEGCRIDHDYAAYSREPSSALVVARAYLGSDA